jgi:hypothetical protein
MGCERGQKPGTSVHVSVYKRGSIMPSMLVFCCINPPPSVKLI